MRDEEIKLEAKKILDSFIKELSNFELEEDFILEREECTREEGEGLECDPEFKNFFLSNAKKISGDAILANKADWE